MDKIQEMLPVTFPTVINLVKTDSMYFELKVECEAKDFEVWLKEFENITKTNYTIRKNSSQGILYERTIYATCHHNTYGKFYNKDDYKHGSKNTQCPAKIQLKKQRPLLDGLNSSTLIFVNYNHNHPILAADSLRFRKPTDEVKEKFIKFFENGHTSASAIQAHTLDIILENPDNYDLMLADNSLNPNHQWVSRLYKKVADSNYGSYKLNNVEQAQLIAKLALEKDCCYKIVDDGNQVAIILVTKMMLRICVMPELGETCFVDSSGGVDRDGTRFFIFLGKCHAGGVPLAIVLTTSECQHILIGAFKALRELLPCDAFGRRSNLAGPLAFVTDDCAAERNALREVWPNAALLLCIFHVLQALWRWLFDKKHNIELRDRSHLLNLFKVMMYATSEEHLEQLYHILLHDSCAQKYPNYVKHVTLFIERRAEWALCYRGQLLVRGNNTNNLCESAMMIMKDYVLQRVKAYNIVQLADFVITRLDLYFEQKILKVAFNRLSSHLLCKQACLERNVEFAKGRITEEGDNIYSVPSEKDATKRYIVNMDLAFCECIIGKDGRLCKHQVAVVKFMKVSNRNIMPINDPKQKQYLYYVATGKKMDLEFFHSLRSQQGTSSSTSGLCNSALKQKSQSDIVVVEDAENEQLETETTKNDESSLELNLTEAEKNMKHIFDDLLNKLKENPDIYLPAIQTFSKKYQDLKTDANLVSSLYCFGKTLNESTVSTSVYSIKRKGKKIPVQPTAISRRRILQLGKGSSSSINVGRPHKPKILREHKYATNRELSKAPHNLASCVDKNISSGR